MPAVVTTAATGSLIPEFPLVRIQAPIRQEFLVKAPTSHAVQSGEKLVSGSASNGTAVQGEKRKAGEDLSGHAAGEPDGTKRTKLEEQSLGVFLASSSAVLGVYAGADDGEGGKNKDRGNRGMNKGYQRKVNKAPVGRMNGYGDSNCRFASGHNVPAAPTTSENDPNLKIEDDPNVKSEDEPNVKSEDEPSVKTEDEPNVKIEDELDGASLLQTDILNTNTSELRRALRKNEIPFWRTDSIMDWINRERKERSSRDARHLGPNGPHDLPICTTAAIQPPEKIHIDFRNKTYLAPLTTVGNLPFRRLCVNFGCDITCSEMAICTKILSGESNEWALLKRWEGEKIFGVQLAGKSPEHFAQTVELLTDPKRGINVDFFDINCGCPTDDIFSMGCGSALMGKTSRLREVVRAANYVSTRPITVKIRKGIEDRKAIADQLIPKLYDAGAALVTLHGRSRQQRYTKEADWSYIGQCGREKREREHQLRRERAEKQGLDVDGPFDETLYADPDVHARDRPVPAFFGNGDVLHHQTFLTLIDNLAVDGVMIGRGALTKPWIFTEIKERRVWDISSRERFDMLQDYARFGVEHWGTDNRGIAQTRRFLLEWCSFLHRYVPVGLLERYPESGEPMFNHMNARPREFRGRDELETLMASPFAGDWVKLTEMIPLLGKVPDGFSF
ncbi:tRNA-dihydrouridine(47) synthase [NAD(P)(+)]-like protein, partial [Gonapodya sp. JEL0774]